MRISDIDDPEFKDAELGYRRGLEHGAYEVFQLIRDGADLGEIRRRIDEFHQWRLNGMREFAKYGRVNRIPPPRRRRRKPGQMKDTPLPSRRRRK